MKQRHQLKNAVLMMALAAAYPMQSFAAAGITQFSSGDVTLRRGTASADPLVKGKDIESGDAIVTGPNGRAQVRFSDGGLVSLQPNSQFNISNYADKNDAKQDSFLVDLLRGGMRTVTGLIGKRNRENFKVTTTTATIGIRGSAFNMAYNPDGTLSVSTELDEIEVCTRAGCVGLKAGESALVVSAQDAPIRTHTRASLPTPEPRQDPEVVANQTNAVPLPSHPQQPLNPRVVAGMAFASSGLTITQQQQSAQLIVNDGEYVDVDQRSYLDGALAIDADGNPEVYLAAANAARADRTGTATVIAETGTAAGGDLMILGTWTANTWTAGDVVTNVAPAAFVTGQPTPSTALTALVGQRGEYAFTAGTPVFSSVSTPGEILSSSKLTVDFLAAGNYVDVSLNVRMPAPPQEQPTVNIAPVSTDYNLRGSGTGNGSGFGGFLSVSSESCVAGAAYCGTGKFNGFLGGNNAEQAGVTFAADTYQHGLIGGAATFTRGATTATPQNQMFTTGFQAGFMDGSGFYQDSSSDGAYYDGEFVFNGDQLVKWSLINGSSTTSLERVTAPGTFGALGKVTDSDFIGWGNWVDASRTSAYTYGYGYGGSSSMLDSLHYIVGKPTPYGQMPTTGYASYSLLGGTAPTARFYNGSSYVTQVGTLESGYLSVDFYNASVGVNIQTKFGATAVSISNNAYISNSSFRSSGGDDINGIFTGAMAYRAGLVYGKNTGGPLGRVTGAAAFQRTGSSGLAIGSPGL